ncbi:hypothetical protein F5883DRAFT_528644 [Diaporthe sp. PMI_573]|nr:hypothetical protein F5883DRAFT_528644 [Diaporthaceae sp. PMI_573]
MFGMMSGLYGNLPLPPFSCPGVNCTYPVVTSLGMCSTCEDVTERTVADCNVVKHTSWANSLSSCNYTLPGGSNISVSETQTTFGMNFPTINTSTSEEPNLYPHLKNGIYNFTEIPRLYNMNVVRFDIFEGMGNLALHNSTEWMDTMTAHECVFELCAWSFTNWSHLDGALQEGSVAQSKLRPRDAILDSGGWYQEWPFPFEASEPDFPGNHSFEIAKWDRWAMIQTFYAMWDRATGNEAAKFFSSSLYLADPDISHTLDAMARGITYNMMSGPNSTISRGQVFKTETFINVRWEWLTLSVVTVVGAVVLLAATIVKTSAMHQRAWKSSLAPLLYADSTMIPAGGKNGGADWGKEDKVQRRAAISTGLLAASAIGAASALS